LCQSLLYSPNLRKLPFELRVGDIPLIANFLGWVDRVTRHRHRRTAKSNALCRPCSRFHRPKHTQKFVHIHTRATPTDHKYCQMMLAVQIGNLLNQIWQLLDRELSGQIKNLLGIGGFHWFLGLMKLLLKQQSGH
jgi:hypothetical protein